jgi:hypothetical protein
MPGIIDWSKDIWSYIVTYMGVHSTIYSRTFIIIDDPPGRFSLVIETDFF